MGQAKQRGTLAERKQAAIQRANVAPAMPAVEDRHKEWRNTPRMYPPKSVAMLCAALAMANVEPRKR